VQDAIDNVPKRTVATDRHLFLRVVMRRLSPARWERRDSDAAGFRKHGTSIGVRPVGSPYDCRHVMKHDIVGLTVLRAR